MHFKHWIMNIPKLIIRLSHLRSGFQTTENVYPVMNEFEVRLVTLHEQCMYPLFCRQAAEVSQCAICGVRSHLERGPSVRQPRLMFGYLAQSLQCVTLPPSHSSRRDRLTFIRLQIDRCEQVYLVSTFKYFA